MSLDWAHASFVLRNERRAHSRFGRATMPPNQSRSMPRHCRQAVFTVKAWVWLNLIHRPKTSNASDLWCFLCKRKSSRDVSSRFVRKINSSKLHNTVNLPRISFCEVFGSTHCSLKQAVVLFPNKFKTQFKIYCGRRNRIGWWVGRR